MRLGYMAVQAAIDTLRDGIDGRISQKELFHTLQELDQFEIDKYTPGFVALADKVSTLSSDKLMLETFVKTMGVGHIQRTVLVDPNVSHMAKHLLDKWRNINREITIKELERDITFEFEKREMMDAFGGMSVLDEDEDLEEEIDLNDFSDVTIRYF